MKSICCTTLLAVAMLFAGAPAATRLLAQDHDAARANDHKFSDQDRQAAQDWHKQHADHPAAGFRSQDRLAAKDDARVRAGEVMDADMRKHVHPVPADLLHRLGPAPHGYRYVVIGGHICEVDSGWHIMDVIDINL